MKVFSVKPRKGGKFTVKIGFDSGKRYTKILTEDQVKEYLEESEELTPHRTPFDKMNNRY